MKGRAGKEARKAGQTLSPTVFVGGDGVTDAVAAEAAAQLKNRDLLKAKVSREAADASSMKEVGADLAERAHAELIEVRGRTVLLARTRRLRSADVEPPPKRPRRPDVSGGRRTQR